MGKREPCAFTSTAYDGLNSTCMRRRPGPPSSGSRFSTRDLLVDAPPPVPDRDHHEPHDEHEHGREHQEVDDHVTGVGERDHWFACDRSQRPKVVNATITASIQYWDWVATRARS